MTVGTVSRVRVRADARVRVTVDPYTSVLALACAAVATHLQGRDARLVARLSGRELHAVSRLVMPGASVVPEALTPAAPERDTDVVAELERLRSMSAADLHADIALTWSGTPPAPVPETVDATGLAALLTPVRAELLRLLGTRWMMSGLAAEAGLAPATLTHQIAALVADGLVARRRDGRRTLVERTARGTALLDLYGVPDRRAGSAMMSR